MDALPPPLDCLPIEERPIEERPIEDLPPDCFDAAGPSPTRGIIL